jgi:hypothetical protein
MMILFEHRVNLKILFARARYASLLNILEGLLLKKLRCQLLWLLDTLEVVEPRQLSRN